MNVKEAVLKNQRNGWVCKVRTEEPENFDEEVKSLVTACRIFSFSWRIYINYERKILPVVSMIIRLALRNAPSLFKIHDENEGRTRDERLTKCPWKIECFLEDLFLGSQWLIILGYRRLSVKSLVLFLNL